MKTHGTAFGLGQYNEVLAALVKSLPGALDKREPKMLISALQKKGGVLSSKLTEIFKELELGERWKIWKTVSLDAGYHARKLLEELSIKGCGIGPAAVAMCLKFEAATIRREMELVLATPAQLGFNRRAGRAEIYERASELGLDLCPGDVAFYLRLHYNDQPDGDWILIAMEPILGVEKIPVIFRLRKANGELRLDSDNGEATCYSLPDHKWLFIRSRKK